MIGSTRGAARRRAGGSLALVLVLAWSAARPAGAGATATQPAAGGGTLEQETFAAPEPNAENTHWWSNRAVFSASDRYRLYGYASIHGRGWVDRQWWVVRDQQSGAERAFRAPEQAAGYWPTPPALGDDGRAVLLTTPAALVPADDNHGSDTYLLNLETGSPRLVSTDGDGRARGDGAVEATMSPDGRFVAYGAYDYVEEAPGVWRQETSLFLADLVAGNTTQLTPDATGGLHFAYAPAVNADGSVVAFSATYTRAGETVPNTGVFVWTAATGQATRINRDVGSGNDQWAARSPLLDSAARTVVYGFGPSEILAYDRATGVERQVAVGWTGRTSSEHTNASPVLSSNGRYVAFLSDDADLVPGDTNRRPDVYLRDLTIGQVERVNLTPAGEQLSGNSHAVAVSPTGAVAYGSDARELVPGVDGYYYGSVFVRTPGGPRRAQRGPQAGPHALAHGTDGADVRLVRADADLPLLRRR